jgi:hypothetical protein
MDEADEFLFGKHICALVEGMAGMVYLVFLVLIDRRIDRTD